MIIKYTEIVTKFLLFLLTMIFINIPIKAQISGFIGNDTPKYDYSDFKVISAAEFVKKNFKKLKKEYDLDPATLNRGYRIEVVPAKNKRYRPSVRTNALYPELIENAVLEWAKNNNYTVYNEGGAKNIVYKLSDGTEISIDINPFFWGPPANKTIEQNFRDEHPYTWTNKTNNYTLETKKFSTFHGLETYEFIVQGISDKKIIEEFEQKLNKLIRAGQNTDENAINNLKEHSNFFNATIEVITSRYGDITAGIQKTQKNKGISANLDPLKSMMQSMMSFCDFKINEVIGTFLSKIKK